jgi:hypothetical protein
MRTETCKLPAQMDNTVERREEPPPPQARAPDLARWFYSVLTLEH